MTRTISTASETHNKAMKKAGCSRLLEKFIRFCESDFGKRVMDMEAVYLRRELTGCTRILDVGCGIGNIEERLPELNITGLDASDFSDGFPKTVFNVDESTWLSQSFSITITRKDRRSPQDPFSLRGRYPLSLH